jgi:hypothetical protein
MTRTRRTPGGPPGPAAEPAHQELHAYVGRQAIFDRPLPEIIAQLPLSALVREALTGGASRPARILDTVRHQNRGDLSSLAGTGLSAQAVFMAWYEAMRWADDIMRQL